VLHLWIFVSLKLAGRLLEASEKRKRILHRRRDSRIVALCSVEKHDVLMFGMFGRKLGRWKVLASTAFEATR
jgi:hypothetical protein